ncbi:broad-range acid phosphatase DET1 [Citrus sinensis]|uniref:Broad-range acid phosphatase DET1 n=1 Tax=Citrus sinensis TaxID=2711 RepID=A0ACB8LPT8_CITSI|nr:broad-range acid phosphatase DET1 [Citrus sinensis]
MATIFLTPASNSAPTATLSGQLLRRKSNCYNTFKFKCCHKTAETIHLHQGNGKAGFSEKGHQDLHKDPPPPRPRRIILVRHGESEGNVDESAYTRVADPKIALTEKGKAQSEECGRRIRQMIEQNDGDGAELDDDWQVYFYVSPYTRTLQTLQFLGRAFERSRIAGMTKEPRLREQDFGIHPLERMRVEKAVRLLYGRFFYRFPNGESAADVYDRITGFRETLRADIDHGRFQPPGHRSQNMNIVIVSHGLTLRVFLMRWYKWTVEQFEGLNNLGNGGIIVMEKGYGGRYSLLVHHTEEELREFGLTNEMLIDQEW